MLSGGLLMDQNQDLKTRIFLSCLSRKVLAEHLGLSYNQFCHRLNGFTRFTSNEEWRLNKILADAEATRDRAERERGVRE
jgi:hypothetical protein